MFDFSDNTLGLTPELFNAVKSAQLCLDEFTRQRENIRKGLDGVKKFAGKPFAKVALDAVDNSEKAAKKAFDDYLHWAEKIQALKSQL